MLELIPLGTAIIDVSANHDVGVGPAGARSVGDIAAVRVEGERLKASLVGSAAADWMVRTGSIAILDVRMTLRTDDGALIFVQYGGRLDMANRENGLNAYCAPTFETGDERYAWLNSIQAVGKGRIGAGPLGTRIDYELFEVR